MKIWELDDYLRVNSDVHDYFIATQLENSLYVHGIIR